MGPPGRCSAMVVDVEIHLVVGCSLASINRSEHCWSIIRSKFRCSSLGRAELHGQFGKPAEMLVRRSTACCKTQK